MGRNMKALNNFSLLAFFLAVGASILSSSSSCGWAAAASSSSSADTSSDARADFAYPVLPFSFYYTRLRADGSNLLQITEAQHYNEEMASRGTPKWSWMCGRRSARPETAGAICRSLGFARGNFVRAAIRDVVPPASFANWSTYSDRVVQPLIDNLTCDDGDAAAGDMSECRTAVNFDFQLQLKKNAFVSENSSTGGTSIPKFSYCPHASPKKSGAAASNDEKDSDDEYDEDDVIGLSCSYGIGSDPNTLIRYMLRFAPQSLRAEAKAVASDSAAGKGQHQELYQQLPPEAITTTPEWRALVVTTSGAATPWLIFACDDFFQLSTARTFCYTMGYGDRVLSAATSNVSWFSNAAGRGTTFAFEDLICSAGTKEIRYCQLNTAATSTCITAEAVGVDCLGNKRKAKPPMTFRASSSNSFPSFMQPILMVIVVGIVVCLLMSVFVRMMRRRTRLRTWRRNVEAYDDAVATQAAVELSLLFLDPHMTGMDEQEQQRQELMFMQRQERFNSSNSSPTAAATAAQLRRRRERLAATAAAGGARGNGPRHDQIGNLILDEEEAMMLMMRTPRAVAVGVPTTGNVLAGEEIAVVNARALEELEAQQQLQEAVATLSFSSPSSALPSQANLAAFPGIYANGRRYSSLAQFNAQFARDQSVLASPLGNSALMRRRVEAAARLRNAAHLVIDSNRSSHRIATNATVAAARAALIDGAVLGTPRSSSTGAGLSPTSSSSSPPRGYSSPPSPNRLLNEESVTIHRARNRDDDDNDDDDNAVVRNLVVDEETIASVLGVRKNAGRSSSCDDQKGGAAEDDNSDDEDDDDDGGLAPVITSTHSALSGSSEAAAAGQHGVESSNPNLEDY